MNFAPGGDSGFFPASIAVTGLSGSEKDHFELSFGVTYLIDIIDVDDELDTVIGDIDENDSFLALNFAIGYRKQFGKGGVFRAGLGLPESLYVGWGYGF